VNLCNRLLHNCLGAITPASSTRSRNPEERTQHIERGMATIRYHAERRMIGNRCHTLLQLNTDNDALTALKSRTNRVAAKERGVQCFRVSSCRAAHKSRTNFRRNFVRDLDTPVRDLSGARHLAPEPPTAQGASWRDGRRPRAPRLHPHGSTDYP
jgi:hypothetical protein